MRSSVKLALDSRLAIGSPKSVTVACAVSILPSREANADLSSAVTADDIDWRWSSSRHANLVSHGGRVVSFGFFLL